jgi:anti-sigma28 factor (negative regulator of flagellin synthesis)
MRLHLNSQASTPADTAQTAPAGSPGSISQSASSSQVKASAGSGSQDSIAISGPSSALASLTADRAARIDQITASVHAGTYQISSAALSGAIVAHAASR